MKVTGLSRVVSRCFITHLETVVVLRNNVDEPLAFLLDWYIHQRTTDVAYHTSKMKFVICYRRPADSRQSRVIRQVRRVLCAARARRRPRHEVVSRAGLQVRIHLCDVMKFSSSSS